MIELNLENFAKRNTILIGECGSGKTTLVSKILGILKNLDDSKNVSVEVFNSPPEINKLNQIYANHSADPNEQLYIVFDDCVRFLTVNRYEKVIDALCGNHKPNINIIVTAQSANDLSPIFRKNMHNTIFTKVSAARNYMSNKSNKCNNSIRNKCVELCNLYGDREWLAIIYQQNKNDIDLLENIGDPYINNRYIKRYSFDAFYEMAIQINIGRPKKRKRGQCGESSGVNELCINEITINIAE